MTIQFNHTIVPARDPLGSATFLAEILGRDAPRRFGPFWTVSLDNGVTLDFQHSDEAMPIEHYAFLVSEPEFDAIFARIRARGLEYWRIPCTRGPARSIATTVAAGSTGTIPTVTIWKSSPGLTAAARSTDEPPAPARCCSSRPARRE